MIVYLNFIFSQFVGLLVTIWWSAVVSHHPPHHTELATLLQWAETTLCTFFHFSATTRWSIQRERESPMIKDDQGGSIRREERAKMLGCNFALHAHHHHHLHHPAGFSNLSSLGETKKWDSFHGLKLYTWLGELSTVSLKYKFLQEMSVNLAARGTPG